MIRRTWQSRFLIASLTRRQFQLRYRQSFAGVLWAILPPLGALGVGSLVFGEIAGMSGGKHGYVLETMAALVPWTFFASSLTLGVSSVVGAASMVTRLAFSRGTLPLSTIGMSLLDFGIAGSIFLVMILWLGKGIPSNAVWVPALLLIEVTFIAGLVLLTSAINVFARDMRLAMHLLTQFWLLVTPVMYPLSSVPENLRTLFFLNPMTGLIESFRRVLVYGQNPDPAQLLPALGGALGVFVLGWWYFNATESRFADVI